MKDRSKKKRLSFLNRVLLFFNYLFGIALLISYISLYVNPNTSTIPSFFGLIYPYLLIVNILFALYWMALLKKYVMLSLVFVLIGYNQIPKYFQFGNNVTYENTSSVLKVLTFNAHYLKPASTVKNGTAISEQTIIDFLASVSADVIMLQEFRSTTGNNTALINNISSATGLPHYLSKEYFRTTGGQTSSLILFSRYPIVKSGCLRYDDEKAFTLFADVVRGNDTLRIYNVHLQSIYLLEKDLDFVTEIPDRNISGKNFKEQSKKILSKLREAYKYRGDQVVALKNHLKQSPHPVVLVGDFNDTPTSYAYHALKGKMNDSFTEAGRGTGFTYSGSSPIPLRIDFVFYDESMRATSHEIHRERFSDHYPVSVVISR